MLRTFFVLAALLGAVPVAAQPAVFTTSQTNRVALSKTQARYLDALHGFQGEPRLVLTDVDVLQDGAPVLFPLADGAELVTEADRIERFEAGAFSWFGTVRDDAGQPTGQAIVSVRAGRMIGEFVTPQGTYVLKPIGDDLHALVLMDETLQFESEQAARHLPRAHAVEASASRDLLQPAEMAEGATVYRVLFPFTGPAENVVPDVALVAQQAIAYANQSYANSQIPLRAEFAGILRTSLPESSSTDNDSGTPLAEDLCRASGVQFTGVQDEDCSGYGLDIRQERDRVAADVVTVFRTADRTNTSGIAGLCTGAASAYGVFEVDGTGTSPVFTHEVGHIFGGGHEDGPGCDSYSRAKEREGGAWRTVMYSSYSTTTTIPYFSNPGVRVMDTPTGDFNSRDNAKTLRERAAVVAAFRGAPGPSGVAVVQPGSPVVQVVPGTTEPVDLAIENTGAGPLTWYGITSASPDFRFHTLGQIVQDEINDEGTLLAPTQGSCSSGNDLTEGFATFEFGFPFPFDGAAYTQARVSPNGVVVFDGFDGCVSALASSIPSASGSDAFVSAFLSPDVSAVQSSDGTRTEIYVKTLEDGRRALTWTFVGFRIPDSNSFFPVDAQAVFGPDGSVEFRYDNTFRVLVGDTEFTTGGGTTYSPPLTTDILVGVEYAPNDGTQVPFSRLSSAGQILFPNPALELLDASRTVQPAQVGAVPVQINADRLPLGEFTLPLQLITNAPNAPILEIPIRVQVVTVIDTEDAPDATLAVAPIQPNPSVTEATVRYVLAAAADVSVSLFDALGRRVRHLEIGARAPGGDELVLDTSGLAPGVYTVRLAAGEAQATRRLTVVR